MFQIALRVKFNHIIAIFNLKQSKWNCNFAGDCDFNKCVYLQWSCRNQTPTKDLPSLSLWLSHPVIHQPNMINQMSNSEKILTIVIKEFLNSIVEECLNQANLDVPYCLIFSQFLKNYVTCRRILNKPLLYACMRCLLQG